MLSFCRQPEQLTLFAVLEFLTHAWQDFNQTLEVGCFPYSHPIYFSHLCFLPQRYAIKSERTGDAAQLVNCLPKPLGSIDSTT